MHYKNFNINYLNITYAMRFICIAMFTKNPHIARRFENGSVIKGRILFISPKLILNSVFINTIMNSNCFYGSLK